MKKIEVSVICLTYNHGNFVREMLESVANQVTDFDYEVIVHDDCSTDMTPKIILEYEHQYPDKVKAIYQTENQYSKGVDITKTFIYPRIKGRYIAFCEGDDYWSNPYKLQQQFRAMEKYSDCTFCVHKTKKISKNGEELDGEFPPVELLEGVINKEHYIELELKKSGWLFQTSSYFFRKSVVGEFLDSNYRKIYPMGDLPMVLTGLITGNCYYIKQYMSCYRISEQSAIGNLTNDIQKGVIFSEKTIKGHEAYNIYSGGIYNQYLQYAIKYQKVQILKQSGRYSEILNKEYSPVFRNLNIKNKGLILLGTISPTLANKVFKLIRMRGRRK